MSHHDISNGTAKPASQRKPCSREMTSPLHAYQGSDKSSEQDREQTLGYRSNQLIAGSFISSTLTEINHAQLGLAALCVLHEPSVCFAANRNSP